MTRMRGLLLCAGLIGIVATATMLAVIGGGRFQKTSSWVIDYRETDDTVLSRVDVLRDGQTGACYAVYRWFTGTGGATMLATVPCDDPDLVYPAGTSSR